MAKLNSEEKAEIKNELRSYMAKRGVTVEELARRITEKFGRNESTQNLSQKLNRGTIIHKEVLEIAEVLGYKIQWIDTEKN